MRLTSILIALLLLAPLPVGAQIAPTPAPAAAETPDATEAARLLADVIEDPASRDALVKQLRLAAEGTPVAEPAPSLDQSITAAVAGHTLDIAETISQGVIGVGRTVTDFEGMRALVADIDWRRVLDDAVAVGVVMLVTIGMFMALRRLTRGLREGLSARLGGRGWLNKLLGLAVVAVFDLALMLIAWASGYGLALSLGDSGRMDLRQSLFLNAFLVTEIGKLILRLLLAPYLSRLRFWPMSDAAARQWYTGAARILSLLCYGVLLAVPIARASVSLSFASALQLAIVLVAAFLAIRLIMRNRVRVKTALTRRANRDPDGVVGRALAALAQIWHLLAVAYVVGVFLVWSARPADSLGFVAQATLQSVAAVVIGTLAMVLISRTITGGINLSDAVKGKLPMLEQRLNTFVPNILAVVRIVLFVVVVAAILRAWNLFDLGQWLTVGIGLDLSQRLLSAGVILLVSAITWLLVSSWIDYRLNPEGSRPANARERTLLSLLRNAFTILLVTMAGMLTLASLGVNIGPLLAGAGVVGLAIGFGAQTLVKDIITGAFIQFENAMNTGDVVTAGGITGTVEKLTIRSVALRDGAGTYHLIPFSAVAAVSNFNKDFSYHVAEVVIARQKDVAKVKALMREAFDELRVEPEGMAISGPFDMQGVSVFDDTTMTVRARIMTRPGRHWAVGRAYSERVTRKLDAADIEMIADPSETSQRETATIDG